MKPLRDLVPDVEVDAEGDVAFVKGVHKFGNLEALGGGGEDDEIEIGIRAGGAFDAGAVGPDGDAGKVAVQEGEQGFPLFRGYVEGAGHAQVFPVRVW